MKKRQNHSSRATALQITLSIALLSVSAILFASSFKAAAPASSSKPPPQLFAQAGFYPPLPVPAEPEGTSLTVSLPIDTMDTSVPISTVVAKPVTCTTVTSSQQIIGFQGDFLFDSAVINFDTAAGPVSPAGMTASQWNVSGNVNDTGPGTFKTLRVSAFATGSSNVLTGSGMLYQLNMVRVSNTPGASSIMNWQPPPDDFEFFDAGFNTITPNQTNGMITITGPTPTPGPTATPTPAPTATPTPAPTATPTPAPTATPTPAPTATATPTPAATATPTPAPTATPTPAPTATPTPASTATPTPASTATPTPTEAPTATPTPAPTSTPTPIPTDTPIPTPTETPAPTETPTPTPAPTATPTPCTAGSWMMDAPIPQDRYGAAATSNGTLAYVAGGYTFSTATSLNDFRSYDPATDMWTALAPIPDSLTVMPSAVYSPINNKVYLFGGEDINGPAVSDATRIYDIASDSWSAGANMPAVRCFMASGYYNGKIYLVSGYSTGNVTDAQPTVWEYDPLADTWNTSRTPIPHAVGGAGYGIINGHFYVAGGRDASNNVIDLVWDYDIAADTWTARANTPAINNIPGSGVLNGRLWLFGGGDPFRPDTTDASNSYDPVSNTWSSGPALNGVRSFVAGTAIGNTLIAVGGYDGKGSVSTVETLSGCEPTPTPTPTPACMPGTFDFAGPDSPLFGPPGNIRNFTAGGVNVNVSAFNRINASGAWDASYLGQYVGGLGVTDSTEGDGENDRHKIDNIGGSVNYVLFEFSSPVIVDQAFLDVIGVDSDMSAWFGNATDPFNNHLTLSDALLASFGTREDNFGFNSSPRFADINASQISGNVLVVSALVGQSDDAFKIHKLLFGCPGATPTPTPAVGITTSPDSITFTGVAGGPNPAPQSIQVTTGNGATWHSFDTSPWFDARPTSGASGASTTLFPHTQGLAAGTYYQNITFSATGLPTTTVLVTLILTPAPTPTPTATPAPTPDCPPTQICVSPDSVTFTGVAGGPNPAPQSIQVTTSNGAVWHSSDTSPWFDAHPTTGASGTSTTLFPHTAGFAAGTYHENITFSASGLPNKVVVVTLILSGPTPTPTPTPNPDCPPTQICVSPDSITFTAAAGGPNPPSQSIQVTTSNGAAWHSFDTSPWFNAHPTTGASGTSTTLFPNIAGLAPGTYHENITFSASGLPNKVVVVTLILTGPTPTPTATPNPACPPTQICVSPDSVTFTAVAGGPNPPTQSIQVTTSNGATWSSHDTSPWFDAHPTTGASGTSTTLFPHIAGFAPGTYHENITFSASGLPNKVVVVTLILTGATPTPTAAPTETPTPAPTATPTAAPTETPTPAPTETPTPAPTETPTPAPTETPTPAPTETPTPAPTETPTPAPTETPTPAPTETPTPAPTATPTAAPTATPTATAAPTATPTPAPTATPTATAAPTATPTAAPTATPTATAAPTATPTPTATPAPTATPTATATPAPTATPTPTPTATPAPTQTPTPVPTATPAPTATPTATPAPTATPTATPTPTPGGLKVSLPIDTMSTSVPISTVVAKPVTCTTVTAGQQIIGFQGDFLFDSAVINFDTAAGPVSPAGMTASQWNVSGNVNDTGPGTFKTLRVSAFATGSSNVLTGSGMLYQLNMVRVSSTTGASSIMNWQPDPDNFQFFDAGFNTIVPNQNNGMITITP